MDKIWDRKSLEVGGHWPLWRGWKNRMTMQNRQKLNANFFYYNLLCQKFHSLHHITRDYFSTVFLVSGNLSILGFCLTDWTMFLTQGGTTFLPLSQLAGTSVFYDFVCQMKLFFYSKETTFLPFSQLAGTSVFYDFVCQTELLLTQGGLLFLLRTRL